MRFMRASRTPQLRRKWTSPQWTHRFEAESRFFLVLTTLLRLLLRVIMKFKYGIVG